MGKVKVSNGKESFEIDGVDLQSAMKDGFKPTERLILSNSKTKESFEVDPADVESALNEGFSISDVVRSNQATVQQPQPKKEYKLAPQPTATNEPFDLMAAAKARKGIKDSFEKTRDLAANTQVKSPYEAQLAAADEGLKAQGYDPDFAEDILTLPEGEGFSTRESLPALQELKRTNPLKYQQELSSIKSKGEMYNLIRNKSDLKNAANLVGALQATEQKDFRQATREGVQLIHTFSDDTEEQNALKKNWFEAKAFDYGTQPISPEIQEQFANMNPYMQRAIQYLQDTDKPTYEAMTRLLAPGSEDQWMGGNENSIRRGREMKERELENIGMSLMQRGMEQQLTDLKNKAEKAGLSPEEQQKFNVLMEDYQLLAQDKQGQKDRYPAMAAMDAERLMQESMGANNSIAKKFVLGMGQNFDDAINWVGDLVQDRGVNGDLELLGDKEFTESAQRYTPEKDKLIGSDVVAKFDDDLQKKVDEIGADKSLTEDQKRDKLRVLLANNNDKVSYVANDRAGKTNWTSKSVMNVVGDVASDLVSQLALATVSGGSANAGKIKQLTSLFGGTFATAYNDYYNDALKQNNPNPSQYALVHTTIEAASELINNDFEVVKKLAGTGGTLGKVMSKVSKGEWDDIVKMGRFSKLKSAAATTAGKAFSNAKDEVVEEVASQVAGNVADQEIFNKEMGLGEGVTDTIINTFVGMLPLGLLSLPFNYQNVNRTQKYAMYEAGMNPDKFLANIDQQVKSGEITEQQAQERRGIIEKATKAVKGSVAVRKDGAPMTDNEKTEYAFNQAVLDEIKEQSVNAPEEVKQELKEKKEAIEKEQAEILKPKKPKKKTKETPAETSTTTNTQENAEEVRSDIGQGGTDGPPQGIQESVPVEAVSPPQVNAAREGQVNEQNTEAAPAPTKVKISDKDGNEFDMTQKEDEKGNITIQLDDLTGKFTKSNVKGDKSVASLTLLKDADGYYPQGITVNKELRRKGIATKMMDYVENELGLKVKPTQDLSEEGAAFFETRPSQIKIDTLEDLDAELQKAVKPRKSKQAIPAIEKTAEPVGEIEELTDKQKYAIKNSWRFYSQKYPEATNEDYLQERSEANRKNKSNKAKGGIEYRSTNPNKRESKVQDGGKIVRDGGNVFHTLKRVAQKYPEYRRMINDLLSKADRDSLAVKIGNEKSDGDLIAMYHPQTDKIYLDGNFEEYPGTIIHEAIHAMTAKKINQQVRDLDVKGSGYSKQLKEYANSRKGSKIAELINLYLDTIERAGKTSVFFGKNGIANDRDALPYFTDLPGEYGFFNIHEFITESFTSPDFQDALKKIESNGKTAWDRFVDWVAKLLGIERKGLIDKILDSSMSVISTKRGQPLPKIGGTYNSDKESTKDKSEQTAQGLLEEAKTSYEKNDPIQRVIEFLEPIIKENKNIQLDTKFDWSVPEYEGYKLNPSALGYSFPSGKIILNYDLFRDNDTLYRTALHEMVHAATRSEIETNKAFNEELKKILSQVREAMNIPDGDGLWEVLKRNQIISEDYDNRYGAANEHELLAEVFSNEKFYNFLKGLEYKGDNLLRKIYLAIAKFLSEKYRQVTGAKEKIKAENLADYLMDLTESVISNNSSKGYNGDAMPSMGGAKNVALLTRIAKKALDKIQEQDVRDKLRQIANLEDSEIDEIISAAKAIQSPEKPQGKILTKEEIGDLPSEMKPKNRLRKGYEKYFTSSKGLPKWIMPLKDYAQGSTKLATRQALQLMQQVKKTAKEIDFKDWDTFDKALREQYYGSELTSLKALPPEMQIHAVEMRNMIDGMSRNLIINNFVTPEQALNIESNIGEYMTRTYRAYNEKDWGKRIPKEVKDDAYRFLVQDYFTQADPDLPEEEAIEWSKKKAEQKLQEIIDGIDDKYSPGKTATDKGKDLSILKQRKDVPKEIRDLLGEYTDPGVNFVMTISRMAALHNSAQYLTKLKDLGMGKIFFEDDNKPREASVKIASDGSQTWNPLNGLWTTPEVKEIFKESENEAGWVAKAYLRIVGAVRWGKTVGSVVTQIKNFESNLGFAVMNGHFRAPQAGKSFKYLTDKLFKGEKSTDEIIEKAIKLGLVDQSVSIRELKSMFQKGDLDAVLDDLSVKEKSAIRKLGSAAAKPINYLNRIYATSDEFWKIYGFLNEANNLSQNRYNKPYDQLTKEEQEEIDTDAAERTKNTYPTYDRVWEGAKTLSKNAPIFGNFLSFQAESLRVFRNAIAYAINDLKKKETAGLGARRLAGIIAYMGARTTALYAIAQMTGVGMAGLWGVGNDEDEDQRLQDINKYVPPFIRSGDKYVEDHGDGKYSVYDVGALEPYSTFFKTINAINEGSDGVEEPGLMAAANQLLSPFLEEEMLFSAYSELKENKNDFGSRIYNPVDGFGDKASDVASFLAKKVRPSTIDYINRLVDKEDKANEIAALFGGRGYDVDIVKQFSFKLKAASDLFDANKSALNKIKYNPNSTPEEIEQAEEKYDERQSTLIEKLSDDYQSAIRLGADVNKMDEAISRKKFWQGYNKSTKYQIKTGIIDTGGDEGEPQIKEWKP